MVLDLTEAESQLANLQTEDVLKIIINTLSGMEFLSLGWMSSMIQPFQKLFSNFLKSLRESCYCKVCVPPNKTQNLATRVCRHKAQVSPAGSSLCEPRGSAKAMRRSWDFCQVRASTDLVVKDIRFERSICIVQDKFCSPVEHNYYNYDQN
jgi:hypothetical protein